MDSQSPDDKTVTETNKRKPRPYPQDSSSPTASNHPARGCASIPTQAAQKPLPAQPAQKERESILLSVSTRGVVTPTTAVVKDIRRSIPAPLVLTGNPQLQSEPGAIPLSEESTPDSVIDGATISDMVIRAASIRGDDHRHYGDTRQDSMGFWLLPQPDADGDRVVIACVADGLGSKPLSQRGSASACRFFREEAVKDIPGLIKNTNSDNIAERGQSLVNRVAERIRTYASELESQPDDLSTTLMGALIWRSETGYQAMVIQAGDSTAFILGQDGWRSCYQENDEGLYSTATCALPNHIGQPSSRIENLKPGDMLLLCSDGLANPMRADAVKTQLSEWWTSGAPSLTEFYWQLSFRAQSYGDDRTAICIWVNPETA